MVEKERLDKDKVKSFSARSIFRSIHDMIRASLCFGLMGQAGTVVQAIFA